MRAESLALLLLVASPSRAQGSPSDWRPFGLQGTTVTSLAAVPGRLCAGTAADGVFCKDLSTPGTPWVSRGLAGDTITGLWCDPLRPDIMFAARWFLPLSTLSLDRTLDGGATWEAADDEGTVMPRAVRGIPGTDAVFAAGYGIWRSLDLGGSWTEVSSWSTVFCLEVAPTNVSTIWGGGETLGLIGHTWVSYDGGTTWYWVWNSSDSGDNQTADVAAHPTEPALVLTGHEGFILRSTNDGLTWSQVLSSEGRFFLDWDRRNSDVAYAAGSARPREARAYLSRDVGRNWIPITGALFSLYVLDLVADATRLGVVYVATDDGVYRFFGGASPLCLDARSGIDRISVDPGPCEALPGGTMSGHVIVGDLGAVRRANETIDLGEAECVVDDGAVDVVELDIPDPPPDEALFLLVRLAGSSDYGTGIESLPRVPSLGDCPSQGPTVDKP